MIGWYGLDGQRISAIEANDLLADPIKCRVAHTTIVTSKGRLTVSTVFLVLDHNHSGGGAPVLWESMIFGGPIDQDQRRYTSREEALAGHAELVTLVRTACEMDDADIIAVEEFTPGESEPVNTDHETDIAGFLAKYGPADAGPIRARFPLDVGALVAGQFADAVAYGKSLGLAIDAHQGGGILVRRYQVVAAGPWPDLRRFLEIIVSLGSEAP